MSQVTYSQHGLGRLYAPDARDRNYPMKLALVEELPLPAYKNYKCGPVLDQGDTSECVAYASRQWLVSSPVPYKLASPTTRALYDGAQSNDEFPGPLPAYDGTTVRGAAKYMQQLGLLGTYVWAETVNDMRRFILSGRGTIVMGTDWYESFFNPDAAGLVKIGGDIGGGHSYLCIGYSRVSDRFWFCNSWGEGWGIKGKFFMRSSTVATLLAAGGEAMAGVELK